MSWEKIWGVIYTGIGAGIGILIKFLLDKWQANQKDSDAVKAAALTAGANVKVKEIDEDMELRREIFTDWRQVRQELKECREHHQECRMQHQQLEVNYASLEARFKTLEERFNTVKNRLPHNLTED